MTTIGSAARITRKGKVVSVKALAAVAAPNTCAKDDCTNVVQVLGNFCSVPCATTPKAVEVHESPCGDKACLDVECQARLGIREHLMWNVAQKDRKVQGERILKALRSLLDNPEHAAEGPDFFVEAAIECAVHMDGTGTLTLDEARAHEATLTQTHVQIEKPVLEAPAKAVRKPRTAKHQPRTTDNQEHPVIVRKVDPNRTFTVTQAQFEAAVRKAAQDLIAEQFASHMGQDAQVVTPDVPREVGVLPAIVIDKTLTIPAIDLGDLTLDEVSAQKFRSPYNKARYRKGLDLLPKEATNRQIVEIHKALLAETPEPAKAKKAKKAKKVKTVAVQVDPAREAKIKGLMEIVGMSREEAEARVGA